MPFFFVGTGQVCKRGQFLGVHIFEPAGDALTQTSNSENPALNQSSLSPHPALSRSFVYLSVACFHLLSSLLLAKAVKEANSRATINLSLPGDALTQSSNSHNPALNQSFVYLSVACLRLFSSLLLAKAVKEANSRASISLSLPAMPGNLRSMGLPSLVLSLEFMHMSF